MPSTTAAASTAAVAAMATGTTSKTMSKETCYSVTPSTAGPHQHHYNVTDCKPPRLPMPLQPTFSLSYYNQRPGTSSTTTTGGAAANSLTNPSLDAHMRKELMDTPSLKTAATAAFNLQNIPKHWIWNTSSLLYASYGAVAAADLPHYHAAFPSTLGYSLMGADAASRILVDDKAKRTYESDDSETSDEKKVDDEVGGDQVFSWLNPFHSFFILFNRIQQ